MSEKKHHEFSPSSLERLSLCPGSYALNKKAPKKPKNKDAESGDFLHECIATQSFSNGDRECDSNEKEIVYGCIELVTKIAKENNVSYLNYEELLNIKKNEKILTYGTTDVVMTIGAKKKGIIIDWKTGWDYSITSAKENLQMAAYALGVMQKYNVCSVDTYVHMPRMQKTTKYTYTKPDKILATIEHIINEAKKKDAILSASEKACKYCPGKTICPKIKQEFEKIATVKKDLKVKHIHEIQDEEAIAVYYEKAQIVKKIISAIEDRAKEFAISNDGKCGKYKIQTRRGKRSISSPQEAYEHLSETLSGADFASACTVAISRLEKIYAEKRSNNSDLSKAASKKEMSEKLGGIITHGNDTTFLAIQEEKE